ncbi:MAG TPA: RNA polymerase sigma factor [Longimicrobiaceae bacterium]|nr:RNA polymerase sigma factor [Longimicrobiaceae bacterium]
MTQQSNAPVRFQAAREDQLLVQALREQDENAFSLVLDRHYSAMLGLAMVHVGSRARAEEVVQETWLAVLSGIHRFEGRSSLKTWIFRILVNRAKSYARRESRMIPFSSIGDGPKGGMATLAENSAAGGDGGWEGDLQHQTVWGSADSPEDRLLSTELRLHVDKAIEQLPAKQREVIILRDLEGWSPEEVCNVLGLSETNHRVLLHRARTKVRATLEQYLAEPEDV